MNKTEFLEELRRGLTGLPQDDIDERVSFYGEAIDDRIEEGLSEEEAVAQIGEVGEVVSQIVAETPLAKLVKEKVRPKRKLRAWEIVLIVLGFPVWFSLLAAAFAAVIALYIVMWALVISLWAVDLALAVCAIAGIAAAVMNLSGGEWAKGLMLIGIALLSAGLSLFLFFGCVASVKGMIKLTGKTVLGIKTMFVGKETEK